MEIKNFPECLLGEDRDALDNTQPKLLIDPAFWQEFRRRVQDSGLMTASFTNPDQLGKLVGQSLTRFRE